MRAMADRGDQIEEIGEEERIQINRNLASTRNNFVAIIESDEYVRRKCRAKTVNKHIIQSVITVPVLALRSK